MNEITFNFQTFDGQTLFGREWHPTEPPKAVAGLIHGLGEHSGRYAHLAERLNRERIALIAFDLRGHGRSEGKRGDSPSFEAYMQDLDAFQRQIEERLEKVPRFFYGHSMGGLLVLNYLIRRKPQITGAICSAAGLHTPLTQQKLKMALVNTLSRWLPQLALPSGLDASAISRDPEVVRRYKADPLIHSWVTLRMAQATIPAIEFVFRNAGEIRVPLLILHGTADRLTLPSGSEELARKVPQSKLVLFEGLAHELHNEPEKEEVFHTVLQWMNNLLANEKLHNRS
ncbi:MAG: lysophospholipase [Anaerolineales bacterium]|nr:lysophospholipase [Anaerolineales bacterium]MDW8161112.1 alpha/beta hydrolase [Anaerolineales bacterium]